MFLILQDWINKECFNGNPPSDVDKLSSSLHLWAQSEETTCRSVLIFVFLMGCSCPCVSFIHFYNDAYRTNLRAFSNTQKAFKFKRTKAMYSNGIQAWRRIAHWNTTDFRLNILFTQLLVIRHFFTVFLIWGHSLHSKLCRGWVIQGRGHVAIPFLS